MKTNELKKGDVIRLRNRWLAEVADNMKGNTRMAKVYGFETEIGSVYSHDIVEKLDKVDPATLKGGEQIFIVADNSLPPLVPGVYLRTKIEHTPAQLKLKRTVESFL